MQPHAPPRRKSFATVIITLMVLGFFFFCGLLVLGVGVMVFARAEGAQRAQAMAHREMARAQAELARAEAETRRSFARAEEQIEQMAIPDSHETMADMGEFRPAKQANEPIRVANREITLHLDGQGKVKMDGKPLEQKQLKSALRDAGKGRESAIIVTIKADKKCLFERVASVLTVCQELDIPNVRIATD